MNASRCSMFVAVGLMAALSASASGQEKKKKAAAPKLVAETVKTSEIVYRKTPQGDLKMHVYYPPSWQASDRRPAIVFFFGGGWKGGSHTQFQPQAEYFASRGLVACAADYRILSVHGTTPDQCVVDAKAAIRWVRAEAKALGVDPDKVIGSGGSAGAHLAAATALVPGFEALDANAKLSCVPNALVLFNPALNLPSGVADAAKNDISEKISPTRFLHASAPPSIVFFGTGDKMLAQGKEYAAKAKTLGLRAELALAEDQPHGFFNRSPWLETTTERADRFLASLGYLSGPPTVKRPANAPDLR